MPLLDGPSPPHARSLSETILLVDDDDHTRNAMQSVLSRAGYTTLSASNGQEALALSAGAPPIHLLCTDVILSHMRGIELAAALRREQSDLKTLFVTGYPSAIVRHHGVYDHEFLVPKPVIPRQVLYGVRRALDA